MQLKCIRRNGVTASTDAGLLDDLKTIKSVASPADDTSQTDYALSSAIGEIYIDTGAPFGYSINYSDSGLPEQPQINDTFIASSSLNFISSFLSTFPENNSLIDVPVPTIYFAQYDEVLEDTYYVPIENAFNVRLRHTYRESPMTDEFFVSSPILTVDRYVKNGDSADYYQYLVTADSQVVIDSILDYDTWANIVLSFDLEDSATGVCAVTKRPYFQFVAEWDVPLEPYQVPSVPPAMNTGFSSIAFTFDFLFGEYFVLQEVDSDAPLFGFSFPIENSSEFNNWSIPPLESRIPFQNYSFAVPNFYLKRRK